MTVRERPTLYLYDDARARTFEPFALSRPIATLVAGAVPIWSRWQVAMQAPVGGCIAAPHLSAFTDVDAPDVTQATIPRGMIVANARFVPACDVVPWRGFDGVPSEGKRAKDADANVWTNGGRVVAVRLARDLATSTLAAGETALEALAGDGPVAPMEGWWHDEVWDFIRFLPEQLADDIKRAVVEPPPFGLRERVKKWTPPPHSVVIGDHAVVVHGAEGSPTLPAAVVEPHVLFDATGGPIYVAAGAHIRAFTRLVGPCYVASGATILGGDVSVCSIGPVSKVRGEISTSIVLGYSNKGHDGFVGHSYLGRWVNLGAGTITSNLKNTYGAVAMWTPAGVRDTGLQYLGTLFGDHAKTGIGTSLTTGAVLGAGANVFGAAMPAKTVPPFGWGSAAPYDVHDLGKFVETAERMMKRRDVEMSERMRNHLHAIHAARWSA